MARDASGLVHIPFWRKIRCRKAVGVTGYCSGKKICETLKSKRGSNYCQGVFMLIKDEKKDDFRSRGANMKITMDLLQVCQLKAVAQLFTYSNRLTFLFLLTLVVELL